MDEHDKRAREVREKVLHALTSGDAARAAKATGFIASALRAAVAAERERKGENNATIAAHLRYASEIVENEGESQEWQRYARVFANRLRAEADFHATRSAPVPAPAQAEQRVSEEDDAPLELPPLTRRRAVILGHITLPDTIDIDDGEPDPAALERSRLAARLRARADEEDGKVTESRARWLAHEDRPGDHDRVRRADALSTVLRSEADALEQGE